MSADRWNQKLEQLREYAAEHDGCCDVPQKHPELGIWVNKVRVGCPSVNKKLFFLCHMSLCHNNSCLINVVVLSSGILMHNVIMYSNAMRRDGWMKANHHK